MLKRIHLDANAGAPLLAEARAAFLDALASAASASSVHLEGREARSRIETARAQVAAAVGARPENVVFTSGATEAAVLALTPEIWVGGALAGAGRLYIGETEHPCVLAGGRFPASSVTRLPVRPSGVIDLDSLEQALLRHDHAAGPPYLALMLANNETGVIHPVSEAARLVKAHGGYVFCDAVQALGRIPVDIDALGADFVALSAHKIGGAQGAGALILADPGLRPAALLSGGGQEKGRRAGTENVAAIAAFGVAAGRARHHLSDAGRMGALRAKLEQAILSISPPTRIVGSDAMRLPNTVSFVTDGITADVAVIAFDLEGIAVSAGSACSSGKVAPSHVLQAMGLPAVLARSGIRVSLDVSADDNDIDRFATAWRAIHARMRPRLAA